MNTRSSKHIFYSIFLLQYDAFPHSPTVLKKLTELIENLLNTQDLLTYID